MEKKELLMTVNPVFMTAKGCLGLLAGTGIKEAAELIPLIDMDSMPKGDTMPEMSRSYMVSNEARYHIGNRIAIESDCDVIVDLPCGYVPRGLTVSAAGKTFYGFDLPAVIDEIKPAINELASEDQRKLIHYCAVDATNYDSLRKALNGVGGKICIVTDGLLGYLAEPELDSLCENIRKLLSEFGGFWTTADKYSKLLGAVTYEKLYGGDAQAIMDAMTRGGSQLADVKTNTNITATGSADEVKAYFRKRGFEISEFTYADKLTELFSLKDSPDMMNAVKEAYRNIFQWILTVRDKMTTVHNEDESAFSIDFSRNESMLKCDIKGRLDTITAPELLKKFNETTNSNITEITVNASSMDYVSSAGLRVLLIMCKSLKDKTNFHIVNYNEQVKDIFNVTGFSEVFGL